MVKNVAKVLIIMIIMIYTKGFFILIRNWKADKINGQGTLTMNNGDIYNGEW